LEHLGVDVNDVDIICSSLGNSIGSVGGFCIGKKEVVYHQRLNAAGYVFSASSPPYLLVSACTALSMISPSLIVALQNNSHQMRKFLKQYCEPLFTIYGHEDAPLIHLRLKKSTGSRVKDNWALQKISEECLRNGLAVPRARYVNEEKYQPPPSLRLSISALHDAEMLEQGARTLRDVAEKLL
jgi:serine palmitoyltransferase